MANSNFCVFNDNYRGTTSLYDHTLSAGNTRITQTNNSGSNHSMGAPGTHLFTSGKFYWEAYMPASQVGSSHAAAGIFNAGDGADKSGSSIGLGITTGDIGMDAYNLSVKFDNTETKAYSESALSTGDILQIAVDADNGAIYYGKNNTFLGSGDPTSGASKTNAGATWTPASYSGGWVPSAGHQGGNGGAIYMNWGQDSTFAGARSSGGNADANGFGDFVYSPPSGYLALCSANLPTSSDIDPAETDDDHPVKQFGIMLYTGTGTARTQSGLGFQPDLVWAKRRSGTGIRTVMYDSSRGANKYLHSSEPEGEGTSTDGLTGFTSDGFTLGGSLNFINENTSTYVAWNWRANGGTTSTNTDGDITTTVQANQAAGFSMFTYTGNDGGSATTMGHGLSKAPDMWWLKQRSNNGETSQKRWRVMLNTGAGGAFQFLSGASQTLVLSTNSTATAMYRNEGNFEPTATVVQAPANGNANAFFVKSTYTYMNYCWHNVDGFQKFGVYRGNGSNDGTFIYTGFRPHLVFQKALDTSNSRWTVQDSDRSVNNPAIAIINWDETVNAEYDASTRAVDMYSNGFKIRTSDVAINQSGNDYIFGAWADVPFKYNNAF